MERYERKTKVEREKYYGIDWLRAVACIGIAMMHIKANSSYQINGFWYDTFISSLTHFVYLFMMVSSFVMCLGYFDKVMTGKVNWTEFYKKRYIKILPFFAFLIFVDIVMSFNLGSLFEGLTELTLLHGFVPQELSVIGVGWYLGTVFVFYIMFPFFCVLIQTKKRAWISLAISMGLHFICCYYFELDRHNILFSLMYFIVGGLIYQYREDIKKVKWYIFVPITFISIVVFYLTKMNYFAILFTSSCLLMTVITIKCQRNRYIGFISDISMEIYLSHMVMFSVVEKVHLNTMFGNGWAQYIITCLFVLVGATCFSFVCQKLINKALISAKLVGVK